MASETFEQFSKALEGVVAGDSTKAAQKRGSDVWIAELRFRRVIEATEELRNELDR